MKRITDEWLSQPNVQKVCSVPEQVGARTLFVGGCVRDTILKMSISDIDHAWYNEGGKFNEVALKAISENLNGIPKLSHYRIGNEMLKLLAAPDPETLYRAAALESAQSEIIIVRNSTIDTESQ